MTDVSITRYHDFCAGHRVVGHEGACSKLHGHNYRVHFTVAPFANDKSRSNGLDSVGRVLDFSQINELLCQWLETNWDHKTLLWDKDELLRCFFNPDIYILGIVYVPFNPTAENMGLYLLKVVGPAQLPADVVLTKVVIEETRKCSATVEL
jgi:6-pyruvoyltetrahydropterin/6-carboxytetrahydropterin synthase